MTRLFAVLFSVLMLAGAARAAPVDTGHLTAELVAQTDGVQPGGSTWVALRQKIDKGWHTYWRNSGDSGEATKIGWTLPPGWQAGDFVWATPKRQPTGPLMNYGYADEVLLPVKITAPANARPGDTVTLNAAAAFLVCADICIPEDAKLELTLPVTAAAPPPNARWNGPIQTALDAAPKPAALTAAFEQGGGRLSLAVTGAPVAGANLADAYFFPFEATVIDHAKPQAIERGPQGLTLSIAPGYAFQSGTPPQTLAGILSLGDRAYEITAAQGPAPTGAAGLGPPTRSAGGGSGGMGLPLALAFALLGGLILNLMPCVFPVLAMKAASLAGHGHDERAAKTQGLAFLIGVLVTFVALAAALIAVKAAGGAVGWGFQLQSPPVVAALALVMLLVALNLSGVFEIGTSAQGVGGGLAARGGLAGAFFTGVLAVVVAAPCTAPFMAPALGWALTQSAPAALTIFAALGLGFAAPFVAIAFIPALRNRLPRPGPWMGAFKAVLAFPMYGAAAWLVWVLTLQAGPMALARLLAAAVVLALAAWLLGRAQARTANGRAGWMLGAPAAALALAALVASVWPTYEVAAPTGGGSPAGAAVAYEAYSPERLAAARAEGKPVFVNFTAAWCVTCQVNEKVALSTSGVAKAFQRTGAIYLKADWTRKDAEIAAALDSYGRAGVPLYVIYGAKGGDGVILPQILTEGAVVRALETAAKS